MLAIALSPQFVSLHKDLLCLPYLCFFPLLPAWKQPGVDLPDGGVDLTDSGRLNHQFAGGEDLDRGLGLLYLVGGAVSALWVELTVLVVLVLLQEILKIIN